MRIAGDIGAWTDQRVSELKRLWQAGLSATQISPELGVSRSAVLGKLHRLGISGRGQPTNGDGRARCKKASAERHMRNRIVRAAEAPPPIKSPPVRATPAKLAPPLRLSIDQLGRHTCRWPIGYPGTPGFSYCGHRIEPGFSYCAPHNDDAYSAESLARARALRA